MADTSEPRQNAAAQGAAPGEEPFIVDEATDEALRLHLEQFEGPFEVLLYLIRAQEIDIFDIPISKITDQYIRFLELMRDENLDVAGEFLVMAATLIQIKSKMILPVEVDWEEEEDIEEEDPRLELVEKLLEYRRYREIMLRLQALESARSDVFARNVKPEIEQSEDEDEFLEVSIYDLIQAFRGVLRYVVEGLPHTIIGEGASIDEKIAYIEDQLAEKQSISWIDLFRECKSRVEIVCCFLAILELCRMHRIRAHQHQSFGDIRLFPVTTEVATA
jgi:segregation and condensation protein A